MNTELLSPFALRVARPVSQIEASLHFYVEVLGLERLGGFSRHDGYDGVFVGRTGWDWHIEFTRHDSGLPIPSPTNEDLLVFYIGPDQFANATNNLIQAGIELFDHENSYWAEARAVVCRDPDGYVVVLVPRVS